MIKKMGISFVVMLIGMLIIALSLPSRWTVEKSIHINRSPETIYPLLVNFKQWEKWSIWTKENYDPSMTYYYEGAEEQIGFTQHWTGQRGNGSLTLTETIPNRYVQYHLNMGQLNVDGSLTLTPETDGTKVIWQSSGNSSNNNPFSKSTQLVMAPWVESDLEKNLARLKNFAEQTP